MRDIVTTWQKVDVESGGQGGHLYLEVALEGGREEVGIADQIPIEEVKGLITGVARVIGDSLKAVSPSKAAVEIGMEFAIKEGHLVGLIARGTATANLKVVLEWDRPPSGS